MQSKTHNALSLSQSHAKVIVLVITRGLLKDLPIRHRNSQKNNNNTGESFVNVFRLDSFAALLLFTFDVIAYERRKGRRRPYPFSNLKAPFGLTSTRLSLRRLSAKRQLLSNVAKIWACKSIEGGGTWNVGIKNKLLFAKKVFVLINLVFGVRLSACC